MSQARQNRAPRARWRLVVAAILALLLLVSLLWQWNWLKKPTEFFVGKATGRVFLIEGNLDVDLGRPSYIQLQRVRLSNAAWADQADASPMFSAERAAFSIELLPLLSGRLSLPRIDLDAPQLHLERASNGDVNWKFGKDKTEDADAAADLPQIGAVNIREGQLRFRDPAEKTDVRVSVDTEAVGDTEAVAIKASGTLRSMTVEGAARGGPVLSLTDTQTPYPFEARFRVGRTRGTAVGSVTGLQAFDAARLQLDIRGDTLADLHPLTKLALPETPPYRIAGLLLREGERWTFNNFSGTVGDSDLSGDLTVTYRQRRPYLVAKLKSKQLDLDDLAGFVGATPETGQGETASAQQQQQAHRDDAQARLLPDHPVNLSRLKSMDADVRFNGQSIRDKKTPIDNLDVHLLLKDGHLQLKPLNFGIASGNISSSVDIDARQTDLDLKADIDFTRIDLAKLLPGNKQVEAGAGLIGGRARLSGRGASTAALLGSANGELGIAMRGGRFSNLLLEGVGLDVAEALGLLIGRDRSVALRCAVMDFTAKDGVLTPRAFVVDTTDTNIHIDGSLSLRDETLDLSLHPLPKDFSPLALRSPLHLRGTFKQPQIRVDKKLFLRGGAAAVLGALVTPLAALLPLIETGPGKNADCDALIAAVKRQSPASETSRTEPST